MSLQVLGVTIGIGDNRD